MILLAVNIGSMRFTDFYRINVGAVYWMKNYLGILVNAFK